MDYPSTYPCPTWVYGQGVAPFASRTQFDCGWARQRHTWQDQTKVYDMTFKMSTAVFATWFDWMNTNGYDWFNMALDTVGGSQPVESIRMTGPIQYTYGDFDTVIARVSAEAENA